MFGLQRSDLGLPRFALLRTTQSFLLSGDHPIRTIQKSFDLFFVGVLDSGLHRRVFFVFAVKMEDDLS